MGRASDVSLSVALLYAPYEDTFQNSEHASAAAILSKHRCGLGGLRGDLCRVLCLRMARAAELWSDNRQSGKAFRQAADSRNP